MHPKGTSFREATNSVKKQTKPWPILILSILSFFALCSILLLFPPGASFSVLNIQISYLPIFFVLLFLGLYGLVAFFLKSALQGIAIGGLVVSFLLFRLFNLTNPFFTILLFVLFLCIEGILWNRK